MSVSETLRVGVCESFVGVCESLIVGVCESLSETLRNLESGCVRVGLFFQKP